MPKTRPESATTDQSAPSGSSDRAGLRFWATRNTTGRMIARATPPKSSCTLPHQKNSSRTPATIVPATAPAELTPDHTPIAKVRRSSG